MRLGPSIHTPAKSAVVSWRKGCGMIRFPLSSNAAAPDAVLFAAAEETTDGLSILIAPIKASTFLTYAGSLKTASMLTVVWNPLKTVKKATALPRSAESASDPPETTVHPSVAWVSGLGFASTFIVFTTILFHSLEKSLCGFRVLGVAPYRVMMQNLPVVRSEEHTSELQSQSNLVCRLL